MYVTGWNEIYALDATTGRQVWTYSEARHEGILSEGGIGTNRGVTISGDKAFMVTDHAHLLAFNRFTGQKLWDVEMGPYEESYSSTSPPLPVGELLVVGVAGGEEGARGFLVLSRDDGGTRMAWYAIPNAERRSEDLGGRRRARIGATWMPGRRSAARSSYGTSVIVPRYCGRERTRQPVHLECGRAERETARLGVVQARRHDRTMGRWAPSC